MYVVTANCDGRVKLEPPANAECRAGFSMQAPDAEEAAVVARTLAQQAQAAGWITDHDDCDREVLLCPVCWPAWQAMRGQR